MEQPDGKQTNQNCSIILKDHRPTEGLKRIEFKHVLCESNSNILLSQDHFLLVWGNFTWRVTFLEPREL